MITKGDILDRLKTLFGKEVTNENLHEAIFCEDKHKKILRRFYVGTHTYVHYQIHLAKDEEEQSYVDVSIPGNPYTYRLGVEQQQEKLVINSEPRISFTYLS